MRKKCVMLSNYVVKDRDAGAKAPKDVNAVFEQNFGKIYMLYHINRRYIRNILSWLNMHRLKMLFEMNICLYNGHYICGVQLL